MPKKSVWEMNLLERIHFSLGGKTFRAVILLSAIISVAAVAFGFFLYSATVNREYRIKTWQLSSTAAEALDTDEIREEAEKVINIYTSLAPEEKLQGYDEEYLQLFSDVRTDEYEKLRTLIHSLQVRNDAIAAYTAFLDSENNRMVFICDGDPNKTYCPPGSWDELKSGDIDAYINGAKPQLLDSFYDTGVMPAVVSKYEKYGYRCTAGEKLFEISGYPVFIFFDSDMNRVAQVSAQFLWQYVLMLLGVTVAAAVLSSLNLKKNLVDPLNALADAASKYTDDSRKGVSTGKHFEDLDIRTGDEIENLALSMKQMEKDTEQYILHLAEVTAEKERIGTELQLATRIQADMLPNIFPAFPDRKEFDIYASMSPAKEVGGDFYDFFLIDDNHLGMVIADVSGKGIPAALFMMGSKILVQNYAASLKSPGRALEAVNNQICENNREEMFVTVWLGILNLDTGRLTSANAGHEYPVLKKPDGSFKMLKGRHGLVIGAMPGMKYRDYEMTLEPGSKLFVYTDGVIEATDENGKLFGTERMLKALQEKESGSASDILDSVDTAVAEFVGNAPQFDDLTMMCMHYIGRTGMEEPEVKEIKVAAVVENIEKVTEFVNMELEALDVPLKTKMQIDVVIDEIFANIAQYAYAPGTGEACVRVEKEEEPLAVVLTFTDQGMPFDPLKNSDPDISLPAEDRTVGGLGVFLVRKTMDDVWYEYKDGKNILKVRKKF